MRKLYILSLVILLIGCEDKIWDNPFDSKSSIKKESWTPKDLTIEQTSLNSFQLSWKNVDENIEGYRIDRKIGNGDWNESFMLIQIDSLETITVVDTTVMPNSQSEYNYRLYSYAGKNLSNSIEKKINPQFPGATLFSAEPLSVSKVSLGWKDNSIGEDGFYLMKKVNNGNWIKYDTLPENATAYIDSNVVPNEQLSYQIVAFQENYLSNSVSIDFKVLFSKPINITVEKVNLEAVRLSWLDNTSWEEGYKIDRKKEDEEWQVEYAILDENVDEFIDSDIETNFSYSYQIYAFSEEYETERISEDIHVTFDAPQNLQIQQKNLTEIDISWEAQDQGEDGFRLFREDEFGQWQLLAETQNKNYTDITPNYGENNYKLYAYFNDQRTDSLEQDFNNIILKPENLKSEILTSSSVQLSWENQCQFEHQISVERKNESSDFVQIALLSDNDNQYTDETIDSTVTYQYAVRGFVDPNYSEYSNIDTVLVVKPLLFETVEVMAGAFIYGPGNETQNIDYNFEISKYEVTNAEYADYLQSAYEDGLLTVSSTTVKGNYSGDAVYSEGEYLFYGIGDEDARIEFSGNHFSPKSGFEDHPVTEVTWFGAHAFAIYYRCKLPTEYEWEKTARGNTSRTYPWGNDFDVSYCNYHGSGDPFDEGTTPVGYFNGWNRDGYATKDNRSYYGAYDMAGNVWEWTSGWYTEGSNKHVVRGGSWYNSDSYLYSYIRYPNNPEQSYGYIGFRVVRRK